MAGVKTLPTDYELLAEIYHRYFDVYLAFEGKSSTQRSTKNYVPIDVKEIARALGSEPDLIFGRLFYHLEPKYGFVDGEGGQDRPPPRVSFFALRVGGDAHAVHFPLLASVLADLRDQRAKHLFATWISIIAFGMSLVSFFKDW